MADQLMRRLFLWLAIYLSLASPAAAQIGPLEIQNNLHELADNPAPARVNLGLGTLATQNANAAAITGGGITGVSGVGTVSRIDLRSTCGAVGNGIADDAPALKTCIGLINASYAAGAPMVLYAPAGIYKITGSQGTMPGFAQGAPGAVVGDGPLHTFFQLDATYAGPLFAWSNVWEGMGSAYLIWNPGPFVPASNMAGPIARDFTIDGTLAASSEQDGLVFYDHADHALVENVNLDFLPGAAILTGVPKNGTDGYIRESAFRHVKAWFSGNASKAAVTFQASGTLAGDGVGGGDIAIDDLQIYAFSSAGLTFTAPTAGANFGNVHGTLIRVEGNENLSATGNNVNIGLSTDSGAVNGVELSHSYFVTPVAGHYAVSVDDGMQSYGNACDDCQIISTADNPGLYLGNTRLFRWRGNIVASPSVSLGPTAGAALAISAGDGSENTWTYSVSPSQFNSMALEAPDLLVGVPLASRNVGVAALKGAATGTGVTYVTMDGAAASNENQFCAYLAGYNLQVQLTARDRTNPGNLFAWTLPIGLLSNAYGTGSTAWAGGTPATATAGTTTGAAVSAVTDGNCLHLGFTPPTGNTDTWDLAARITFSRAP